jgi:alpha-mannosidase
VGVVQANGMHAATVRGGDIALSLVRSPTRPDPSTDRGHHRWTVDVMPFAEASEHATLQLHKQAFACELGLLPRPAHTLETGSAVSMPEFTVVSAVPSNVFVASIRREGVTVIIHVYETLGAQTARAKLRVPGLPNKEVRATRRGASDGTLEQLNVSDDGLIALGSFVAFEVAIVTIEL